MSAVRVDRDADALRAAIRERVRAAGTSFYWAMRLLPVERREAMFAVYAFCRVIDDIADSDDPPAVKLAALADWRAEVAAIYAGTPTRPLARVLADVAARHRLRQEDFLALIDGMEMDAREDIVAPSLSVLDQYCDRVASAVGRLSVRIFGDDSTDADRVAFALGRALQLTNILRDLDEDAARGRLYLPRELLERHGIADVDPAPVLAHRRHRGGVRGDRRSRRAPLCRGVGIDETLPTPRDAAGGGDVGGLSRDSRAAAPARLEPARPAGLGAEAGEALARAASRILVRPGRVHVVGAGMAGLAAAVRLARAGISVSLHEAAPHAGGRCRSYFDAQLGCRIDNGNHLLMRGNRAAMEYVAAIGAADTLIGPDEAAFPFLDLATGERWVLRPGAGPRAVVAAQPRAPGAGDGAPRVSGCGAAWRARDGRRRVSPRCSTRQSRALSPLLAAARRGRAQHRARGRLGRAACAGDGGKLCARRRRVPAAGAQRGAVGIAGRAGARSSAPARRHGAVRRAPAGAGIHRGARVTALGFEGGDEMLGGDAALVLAVTAPVAARLVPGLVVPEEFRAIVNAHYRIAVPAAAPLFVGIIGGTAEWVFRKHGVLSVTVSDADRLLDAPADELALRLWRDVARAYDLPAEPMPPAQILKERRATFAATPAQDARRPPARTRWDNLALAGDWTKTALPATVEGAIRSGFAAADLIILPL